MPALLMVDNMPVTTLNCIIYTQCFNGLTNLTNYLTAEFQSKLTHSLY